MSNEQDNGWNRDLVIRFTGLSDIGDDPWIIESPGVRVFKLSPSLAGELVANVEEIGGEYTEAGAETDEAPPPRDLRLDFLDEEDEAAVSCSTTVLSLKSES